MQARPRRHVGPLHHHRDTISSRSLCCLGRQPCCSPLTNHANTSIGIAFLPTLQCKPLECWLHSRGNLNLLRTLRRNRSYLRVLTQAMSLLRCLSLPPSSPYAACVVTTASSTPNIPQESNATFSHDQNSPPGCSRSMPTPTKH